MLPTGDDFEPRRDGWFEHEGTWTEVTVGTVLADKQYRTKRWEVISTAHGTQIPMGHTLWMRLREQVSGEEYSLPPRSLHYPVLILTQDPADTQTPPLTPPEDSEAVELLVRELGAELLATRDEATGEITCPDYTYDTHVDDGQPSPILRGLIEHMRFGHALSVDDDLELASAIGLHGQAHSPSWPNIGKGGFPHRHVPEERVDIDWVRNRKVSSIYQTPQEAS